MQSKLGVSKRERDEKKKKHFFPLHYWSYVVAPDGIYEYSIDCLRSGRYSEHIKAAILAMVVAVMVQLVAKAAWWRPRWQWYGGELKYQSQLRKKSYSMPPKIYKSIKRMRMVNSSAPRAIKSL
jgi:hypothetical protein